MIWAKPTLPSTHSPVPQAKTQFGISPPAWLTAPCHALMRDNDENNENKAIDRIHHHHDNNNSNNSNNNNNNKNETTLFSPRLRSNVRLSRDAVLPSETVDPSGSIRSSSNSSHQTTSSCEDAAAGSTTLKRKLSLSARRRRRGRRVQFAYDLVEPTPDDDDAVPPMVLTAEERAAVWYTPSELKALVLKDQRLVKHLRKHSVEQKRNELLAKQTMLSNIFLAAVNTNHTTNTTPTTPTLDPDLYCFRGLEDWVTMRAALQARQRKVAVRQAVRDEQARQRSRHTVDTSLLRKHSRAASTASRVLAAARAEQDAQDAAIYQREDVAVAPPSEPVVNMTTITSGSLEPVTAF